MAIVPPPVGEVPIGAAVATSLGRWRACSLETMAPDHSSPPALERLRGTVGVWTFAHELVEATRSGELAAEVEACGFSALWFPETLGREAFVNAQLLLRGSRDLVVASGIASIYARDAAAARSASSTLAALSGERFVLGLGVSHRPMVEEVRGQRYGAPVQAMEDYLAAMDTAAPLSPESALRAPVVIAALGPKMLALAGRAADGALPYLVTPDHVGIARAAIGPDGFLAVEQAVVLSTDRSVALERAGAHLAIYTGLDNYRRSWERLGFTEADFVPGGSDRLREAVVAAGDVDDIAARVDELRAAGADHVCLQVLNAEPFAAAPREEWRLLGAALGT